MGETDTEKRTDGDTAVMLYPPRPDELLSSWIIRNSIMQGSDPMGWVYGFWGEWRAWTRDIDRYLPTERIVELSRFSRLSPESIREMTLTPLIHAVEGEIPDIQKAWKWVIPTGKRNRSVAFGLQFCPECLREKEVFFPRAWRLSWHTQCEKHGIRLHDRCDRCALPFSPHLIDYTAPYIHLCPRCGNDLRSMLIHPSCKDTMRLQTKADAILRDPDMVSTCYGQWQIATTTDFFLFLRDILTLFVILSKKEERYMKWQAHIFGEERYGKLFSKAGMTFDMRSITEREFLLRTALHLLEHTPEYLLDSLRHIHTTRSILNEKSFPNSAQMHRLLSTLPKPKTYRPKHLHAGAPVSKEPKTVAEIDRQMNAIRKFL